MRRGEQRSDVGETPLVEQPDHGQHAVVLGDDVPHVAAQLLVVEALERRVEIVGGHVAKGGHAEAASRLLAAAAPGAVLAVGVTVGGAGVGHQHRQAAPGQVQGDRPGLVTAHVAGQRVAGLAAQAHQLVHATGRRAHGVVLDVAGQREEGVVVEPEAEVVVDGPRDRADERG